MASKKQSAGLVWNGPDLPRIPAGEYQATCVGSQGPDWCRQYRRWSLRLEFALLDAGQYVSAFFNFGDNPDGPAIGRKSRFFSAWVQANGELPRKGQRMGMEVFMEGQLYTVRVQDARQSGTGTDKADAEVYSRITDILKVERK